MMEEAHELVIQKLNEDHQVELSRVERELEAAYEVSAKKIEGKQERMKSSFRKSMKELVEKLRTERAQKEAIQLELEEAI